MKHIEALRSLNPRAAQQEQDWLAWRQIPHSEDAIARALALGLHRDLTRSRTHIIIQRVVHVQKARELRFKFRVAKAGIFRVKDAARFLEYSFGLARGTGEDWVRTELEGTLAHRRPDTVPVLALAFNEAEEGWFHVGASPERISSVVPRSHFALMQNGIQNASLDGCYMNTHLETLIGGRSLDVQSRRMG